LGFDAICALCVLELKITYPQIKLILVLPCKNQSERWSDNDKQIYEAIKLKADKIVYTSENYDRNCMYKRNRHLIDHSSVCIAYLKEGNGGTAYTLNYAIKNNIKVINIGKGE
jgi:uncharacterized phage-like protein YoqJ